MNKSIIQEFINFLLTGLTLDKASYEQLCSYLDLESEGPHPSLARKTLNLFLGHQSRGCIDDNEFHDICISLSMHLREEQGFLKTMPSTTIASRRLGLLIKAAGIIQEVDLQNMFRFGEERVPKPYNGHVIARETILKDLNERALVGSVPIEYMAAIVDGQGSMPRKSSKIGCGCIALIITVTVLATWMLL